MTDTDTMPQFDVEEALIDQLARHAMLLYNEGIHPDMLLRSEKYATKVLVFVRAWIDEYGEAPNISVLTEEFRGEVEFEEPVVPVQYIIKKIRDRYAFQQGTEALTKVGRALSEDPVYAAEVALREYGEIVRETTSESADPVIYVREWETELEKYRRRLADGKLRGVTFGFEDIDTRLGGLKGFNVVVGRPKQKKSWMLLHSAVEAMHQEEIPIMFTLEMPKEQMYDRFTCLLTDTSIFRRENRGWTDADFDKYERAMMEIDPEILTMPIYYLPPGQRGVSNLMSIAKKERATVAYIDQYSFLWDEIVVGNNISEHSAHQKLCSDLKAASGDMPIFIAAQFNREAASLGEMGDMNHIGLSDAIPQKADLVMGLYSNRDMRNSSPPMMEYGVVGTRSTMDGSWHIGTEMLEGCHIDMIGEKK